MNRRKSVNRIAQALAKIQKLEPRPAAAQPEPLSYEWAQWVTSTLQSHERQFKILNTSLLTALIADIVLRLFQE